VGKTKHGSGRTAGPLLALPSPAFARLLAMSMAP
jgi:hypothetical protein